MFAIMAARARQPVEEIIWMRAERGARGPRPGHSRDEIAAAAVRIADAEGVEAVSMRRVAAEIGAGATSLYRYVSSKEDLYELMIDAAIGEELPPAAPSGDWRADLRAVSCGSRAVMLRHPWMPSLVAGRSTLGPNQLRVGEFTLGVIAGLGLDIDETLVLSGTLQAFVRGHAVGELAEREAVRRSGLTLEQWIARQAPYVWEIIASGKYPTITRVIMDAAAPHDPDRDERGFALGLEQILDGFAARLGR
jgi:AcrR family transcriptional regulator